MNALAPLSAQEKIELRIGALAEQIRRLAADAGDDEMTLAALHDGTAEPGSCGFASEDECAAFVASSWDAITQKLGELDALLATWAGMVAYETAAAA